jgi:hypothetical protein
VTKFGSERAKKVSSKAARLSGPELNESDYKIFGNGFNVIIDHLGGNQLFGTSLAKNQAD